MQLPLSTICLALLCLTACSSVPHSSPRVSREFWIDLVDGEEVDDEDVFKDLATAGVIYVGEAHTIARHHAVQLRLLQEMFIRKVPLALCLEQLEAPDQPVIDRFNRKEIDFATLAQEINWAAKWRNYLDYRPLCEFARQHGIPVRALNARSDLIRAVSRSGGVAKLTPEQRAQLPSDLSVDDPLYERVTDLQLMAHAAADAAKLRPMFEAQMARDETMATEIIAARQAAGPGPRTAFVVLGAGHMRYGLGTSASVRRRIPGIVERLVLISESGELHLTDAEKAASRDTDISHADLRAVGRPPGDYLRVLPVSAAGLPPGHPPIPGASKTTPH